jgi:hypothetical protein
LIIESILPCLTIFGVGWLIHTIIINIFKVEFESIDKLLIVFISGIGMLIIPWTLFGLNEEVVLFGNYPYVYGIGGFLGIILAFYSIIKKKFHKLEKKINKIQENRFFEIKEEKPNSTLLLIILISGVAADLLFYQLILPIRGYDAIWLYIPDAVWYYTTNGIPLFNLLNFRPEVKEPLTSLLFTYTLYLTGDLNVQLIPWMFVMLWGLIIYKWCNQLTKNQSMGLLGMLMFLISPFTYWLINFWSYYQDIYVGFFFTSALYFIFQASLFEKNRRKIIIFSFIGGIAVALALLSKLNGWAVFLIILTAIPYNNKLKIIPLGLFLPVAGLLIVKGTNLYFGIGLFIILISVGILVILLKKQQPKGTTIIPLIIIIPTGLILGSYWLSDLFNKFQGQQQNIIDTYFLLINKISFTFRNFSSNDLGFGYENAQASDFLSLILFLLIGNIFVVFWLIPKFFAFKDFKNSFFTVWTLEYYIIWLAYHGSISIRYLTPILGSTTILALLGFHEIFEKYDIQKKVKFNFIIFFVSITALIGYYFPISLESLVKLFLERNLNVIITRTSFLQSADLYYKNSIVILIFVLAISMIFYKILNSNMKIKLKSIFYKKHQLKKITRILSLIIVIFLVIFPIMAPTYLIISNNGNIEKLQSAWVYEERPAYKDIKNRLLLENNPKSAILVVNMQGLAWKIRQPVLDISNVKGIFDKILSNNVTKILQFLKNPIEVVQFIASSENISFKNVNLPTFNYIVIPDYGNEYYDQFAENIYSKSNLFALLNNPNLFQKIYENDEFLLYKKLFDDINYKGFVDINIKGNEGESSILGKVQKETKFDILPNFSLKVYFGSPSFHINSLSVNVNYSLNSENKSYYQFLSNKTIENLPVVFNIFNSTETILCDSIVKLNSLKLIYSITNNLGTFNEEVFLKGDEEIILNTKCSNNNIIQYILHKQLGFNIS